MRPTEVHLGHASSIESKAENSRALNTDPPPLAPPLSLAFLLTTHVSMAKIQWGKFSMVLVGGQSLSNGGRVVRKGMSITLTPRSDWSVFLCSCPRRYSYRARVRSDDTYDPLLSS